MNLHSFDTIIINSSGGKDSLVSLFTMAQMIEDQSYPKDRVIVSHQDLGRVEWFGTKELAKLQADHFGFRFEIIKRVDKNGVEETLLDYVRRRGKWPDRVNRWCTSDFKRGPGGKVITRICKEFGLKGSKHQVLYVFGFRSDESPDRSKKEVFVKNKIWSNKTRTVMDFLPIHGLSTKDVWTIIKANKLPYHFAYDLKMPRLSCVFCIFSPFDALVIAGRANPELLDEYIEVEDEIGFLFRKDFSLHEVREAIELGYEPQNVPDWTM